MSWIQDALEYAQHHPIEYAMGNSPNTNYEMADGYNTTTTFIVNMPSNTSVEADIALDTTTNTDASVTVAGNNIDNITNEPVNDGDHVEIVIPPGASDVEVSFTFNGVERSLEDGPVGTLTFSEFTTYDNTPEGDLLKVGTEAGVRVINATTASEGRFPADAGTESMSVRRGVAYKQDKTILGID